MGNTQSIDFCRISQSNTANSTNPDSIINDQYGNSNNLATEDGEVASLSISNPHGQVVQQNSMVSADFLVVNVSEWNHGVYIATVRLSSGRQISKLFVVN